MIPMLSSRYLRRPAVAAATYAAEVLADSPSAYWRFGESAGTNAADASGNGKDGTYAGGYTLSQAGALSGDADTAVLLNGSTGNIDVPNDLISASADLTMEAWFKTSASAEQCIFSNNDGTSGRIDFKATSLSGGTYRLFIFIGTSGGNYALWGNTATNSGAWKHAVAARESGTWTLYLNGQADGSSSTIRAIDNTKNLRIGLDAGGTQALAGTVDEAAIYASALSAARILAHYEAGT